MEVSQGQYWYGFAIFCAIVYAVYYTFITYALRGDSRQPRRVRNDVPPTGDPVSRE